MTTTNQSDRERQSMTNFEKMVQKLGTMTPDEREHLGRVARGDDEDDLIRRGDVYEALRDLRSASATPANTSSEQDVRRGIQRGLGQAQGAVAAVRRAQGYCISGRGTLPSPPTTEGDGA
jgi:hypothetical protein